MCVPLVFLPSHLLSRGLNWGPERPINGEPARLFATAHLQWPNIMFLSLTSPTYLFPQPPQSPHPGDLLLACETTWVNKFLPGASSIPLYTSHQVSFSSNLCPLSTVLHLGHKQGKGGGRVMEVGGGSSRGMMVEEEDRQGE